MAWLLRDDPACAGKWIPYPDLEDHFFPRFQEADGCHDLAVGALLRGLGKITDKVEKGYADRAGHRRSVTLYYVPGDVGHAGTAAVAAPPVPGSKVRAA